MNRALRSRSGEPSCSPTNLMTGGFTSSAGRECFLLNQNIENQDETRSLIISELGPVDDSNPRGCFFSRVCHLVMSSPIFHLLMRWAMWWGVGPLSTKETFGGQHFSPKTGQIFDRSTAHAPGSSTGRMRLVANIGRTCMVRTLWVPEILAREFRKFWHVLQPLARPLLSSGDGYARRFHRGG
jgi:hypothetical protein